MVDDLTRLWPDVDFTTLAALGSLGTLELVRSSSKT
jgi:hypothetical protein